MRLGQGNWKVGPQVPAGLVMASGILALAFLFDAMPVLATQTPTEAIRSTSTEVIRLLHDEELQKPARNAERLRLLEKVVGNRFSYDEMSKRALGQQWNQLTDKEKKEFVTLFRTLLVKTYANKIDGYGRQRLQYLDERSKEGFAEVRTKIVYAKNEFLLDFRMLQRAGEWLVYDVIVDGISLINNYRGQFTKILRSSSYAELVEMLRKKTEGGVTVPPE